MPEDLLDGLAVEQEQLYAAVTIQRVGRAFFGRYKVGIRYFGRHQIERQIRRADEESESGSQGVAPELVDEKEPAGEAMGAAGQPRVVDTVRRAESSSFNLDDS